MRRSSVREAPADLVDFTALYEETMSRLEAHDYYRFPEEYWHVLCTRLRERLVLSEARLNGELVASALCLVGPRWLHYHLSATSEQGRRVGAANLVLLGAARWGQERGLEQFHLGGGMGGQQDSLFAVQGAFRTWQPARDGRRQDRARRRALPRAHREPTTLSFEGYFPAYRQHVAGRR